jgi:hypothetical protein
MESWDIITTLSQVECVVYPITKIKGFVIFYNMKNTKSIDFNIDVWIFWMKNNIYIYPKRCTFKFYLHIDPKKTN